MDAQYLLGFDIGGTKCAVTMARREGQHIELLNKAVCPTDLTIAPEVMIDRLIAMGRNYPPIRPMPSVFPAEIRWTSGAALFSARPICRAGTMSKSSKSWKRITVCRRTCGMMPTLVRWPSGNSAPVVAPKTWSSSPLAPVSVPG
jgi:hypothetical protein